MSRLRLHPRPTTAMAAARLHPAADCQGNIRAIASGDRLLQTNHYYPYGLPFAEGLSSAKHPFKYGGKELLTDYSLNIYDFHARMQFPAGGIFDNPDSKSESYYPLSPYIYCAGNPIRLIDPTGEDCVLAVDSTQQVITVNAHYMTNRESEEECRKGIELWNNLSGEYQYEGFTVNFNLDYEIVERDDKSLESLSEYAYLSAIAQRKIVEGNMDVNVFLLSDIQDFNISGNTDTHQVITINSNPKIRTELTSAHEIGHTLFLEHSDFGLMTPSSSDNRRTKEITSEQVQYIISRVKKNSK